MPPKCGYVPVGTDSCNLVALVSLTGSLTVITVDPGDRPGRRITGPLVTVPHQTSVPLEGG